VGLRGDYKASEYGRVILPLTALGRLDYVLEPTKAAVLERVSDLAIQSIVNIDPVLCRVAGLTGLLQQP
jgi:type I restriction enzyme M protein